MAYDNMKQFPFKDGYSFLEFDGVDIGAACEMFILGKGTYGAPSRDVDQIHVPGRNGDILVDNGGWNNVTVKYPDCNILSNFGENVEKLRGYLFSNPGYHTLIDQYHPDEVRYAEFRGPFTADAHTGTGNDSGSFDLEFNCKPQRFLRESMIARDYVLCPYTIDQYSNRTEYSIDAKVTNAGSTLKFTFISAVTESFSTYANFYKSDGTTVGEYIEVNANDGVVEIPLVGKDGTKYYGVKCTLDFNVSKSKNLRMESSNSVVEGKTTYFYYKYTNDIYFPFYNPTQFDAYILMSGCYVPDGTYGQSFGCEGNKHYISVSKSLGYAATSEVGFDFNGLEGTACTWDNKLSKIKKVYAGLSGTLLVIPGGGRHDLKTQGVSSFKNIQIAPMYYRI